MSRKWISLKTYFDNLKSWCNPSFMHVSVDLAKLLLLQINPYSTSRKKQRTNCFWNLLFPAKSYAIELGRNVSSTCFPLFSYKNDCGNFFWTEYSKIYSCFVILGINNDGSKLKVWTDIEDQSFPDTFCRDSLLFKKWNILESQNQVNLNSFSSLGHAMWKVEPNTSLFHLYPFGRYHFKLLCG